MEGGRVWEGRWGKRRGKGRWGRTCGMAETRLCVVWRSLRRVRVLTLERRIFSGVLRAEREVR